MPLAIRAKLSKNRGARMSDSSLIGRIARIAILIRMNLVVNLFAVDGYRLRCADADAYLLAPNLQDHDFYLVANLYALSELSGEYQHSCRHPWSILRPHVTSLRLGLARESNPHRP